MMPAFRIAPGLLLASLLTSACQHGIMPFDVDDSAAGLSFRSLRNSKGNARIARYWENSSTAAVVVHSGVLTNGDATLTIWDAKGARVYSRSLTQRGTFVSSSGVIGEWKVELHAENASGDLVFTITPGS